MMFSRTLLAAALVVAPLAPQAAPSVEQRLARVEQMVESRGLLDLLTKVEQLEREMRQLRGQMEEQGHRMQEMEGRQRSLYLDIDRRLRRLEAGGVATVAPPPGVEGGGAPAAPETPAPVPAQAGEGATGGTAPVASSGEERAAYEAALDLLREGRYGDAVKAFKGFLVKYPQGGYADNAQYWLGEANYVTRNFAAAIEEFGKVINDYPQSTKVADALLKSGYVYYEMGKWAEARKSLEGVVAKYPRATAAKLAQQRLDRMKSEGH